MPKKTPKTMGPRYINAMPGRHRYVAPDGAKANLKTLRTLLPYGCFQCEFIVFDAGVADRNMLCQYDSRVAGSK